MSINTKDNNEDNLHGLEDLDDTRQTAPIETRPLSYQVKRCCDEMPYHMYILNGNRIDIEGQEFDFEDVKYCLYCGNRTLTEVAPERDPETYKPVVISEQSAKDRALEELKEEMQK